MHRDLGGARRRHAVVTRAIPMLLLIVACSFPPPPDLPADSGTPDAAPPQGCNSDNECSGATSFCVDRVCSMCRSSDMCSAAAPVCDDVDHACRICIKDSECGSGACDLALGTCVDRGNILYASPAGTAADPCTSTAPCALSRASELVDEGHAYVVMIPGDYTDGGFFNAKSATIVGNGSTIVLADLDRSGFSVGHGSIVSIRDFKVTNTVTDPNHDRLSVVSAYESKLTIDNMIADSHGIDALRSHSDAEVTLRRSTFTATAPTLDGRLVADNCVFLAGGPDVSGSITLTNSVVVASDAQQSLLLYTSNPNRLSSEITHNTFVGGTFGCNRTRGFVLFGENILYNQSSFTSSAECSYNYNLVFPRQDLGGVGNISNEPRLVDAPGGDFHLRADSPAIDAGNPGSTLNGRDPDGISRPQGTRSDIGAFEYVR